jgi:predicted Zn finger-like uncharacterized protein
MSFTTRCPACATMFRVVPDQLKISDGWVRCGHCSDVFDATLYLEPWAPPEAQEEDERAQAQPQPASAPVKARVEAPVSGVNPQGPVQGTPFSETAPAPLSQPLNETNEAPAPSAEALGDSAAPAADSQPLSPKDAYLSDFDRDVFLVKEAADDWDSLVSADAAHEEPDAPEGNAQQPPDPGLADAADFHNELRRFAAGTRGEPLQSIEAGPVGPEPEPEPETNLPAAPERKPVEHEPEKPAEIEVPPEQEQIDESGDSVPDQVDTANSDEPDFVRQARQRAFWQSPLMRALMSVVALVLLGVLAGQWALHERDRLAARFPESMPFLVQACDLLGCEVGAVHNIDAILIDSSTLARKLGNFYSFDLVLKNNAPLALAVPALELSLTDTRDNVISRRVFLPNELPGVPPLLPALGTVSVSLRLSLSVAEDQPMAGYRALVFYP